MSVAFRAPGRVNLIGEHVDYVGGVVLPAALERGVTLRGEPAGGAVRLESAAHRDVANVAIARPGDVQDGWPRYVAAVVAELLESGVPLRGFRGRLESDLPEGAGLSSSAALLVCLGGGLARSAGVDLQGMELALLAQRAEHRAGAHVGIMDQAVSALGAAGRALLLDCASLEHRLVPLPPELVLVVVDSGVRRRLAESGYADRRAELERALAAAAPSPLREIDPDSVEGIDEVARRRLRHVVTELRRVDAVVAELERPDGPEGDALGRLFREGHESLRDDFEVSTPELDLLVELAYDEGAVAARMTGGGFGGAIVALGEADAAEPLASRIAERYAAATDRRATTLVSRAGSGAGPV